MNLKHVFKSECPNAEELFADCDTLDAYLANLKKQEVKTENYVRRGFEALVEALIKCEKRAMRIKKYSPVPSCHGDLNVSGTGEKSSGKKVAVMVCYVDDPNTQLTIHMGLDSFFANALEKFGVDKDEPKSRRVFSNAKGLNEHTEEQFGDKSKHFCFKSDIEEVINGNRKFWLRFKNLMKGVTTTSIRKEINLREYQSEASYAIVANSKGQVILPTGTGKSLIAINAIYNEIQLNKGKTICIMIMTPRIVLTYQLLGETLGYLKSKKVDAQYLNLNSGKFDDDSVKEAMADMGLPIRDVPSTTTVAEIEEWYAKAKKDNVPLIISATYQSAPRILSTKIPIHMAIHDEAHNLVDGIGRFATGAKIDVLKINGAKEIFLTATLAFSDSDEGTGMNNEKEYGKEIYRKSPKEMIDAGEIVPPYIHQIVIDEYKIRKNKAIKLTPDNLMDTDIEKNVEFMALVIEEAFTEHSKKVKEYSCAPEKIGAKMLVVCKGENTFGAFFDSDGFKEMKKNNPNIKFFGISSRFGAWIDGEQVPVQGGWYKEQFMLSLKNLKQEDNAVILHIDMLGEGIDVPGITGVLPFRDLGTIKSCQTLGRAMRLVPEDRISFYSGVREARDTKKMIKPFAWVVIPVYSITHKDLEHRVMELAVKIRDEYGFMPFENGHTGAGEGRQEELALPSYDTGKRPDEITLRHKVEDPYFVALTSKVIDDSVLTDDDDMFDIIRKTLTLVK